MKKIILCLCLPASLFFVACQGAQTENKEKESAEIKSIDSLSNEMDNIQSQIESSSAELDDAINDLEPKK